MKSFLPFSGGPRQCIRREDLTQNRSQILEEVAADEYDIMITEQFGHMVTLYTTVRLVQEFKILKLYDHYPLTEDLETIWKFQWLLTKRGETSNSKNKLDGLVVRLFIWVLFKLNPRSSTESSNPSIKWLQLAPIPTECQPA